MENVGWAGLSVIPTFDARKLDSQVGSAMGRTGKTAGSRFGQVFGKAAKVGILGGLAVAGIAVKIGADALGEARDSQKVARQTNAVLKSTGGIANVSSKNVNKLANRLSYMAGIDDELIQSGENVLLTFKGVRNETGKGNKVFDKATKVALNMSTALGRDLKGSSILVGKALNDPVKGLTALTRVGVTFTDQQKAQIKTMVESGDKLGAQKFILKELGTEFGGSARSQASAADRLKVAFGNVEEKLGKGLLPLVQDFQRFLLRKGIPILDDFAGWFKHDGQKAIGDFIDKAKPVVTKWLPKIGNGFKTAGGYAKDAAGFAGDVVNAFDNLPGWVKKILIGGAVGGFAAKKLGVTSLLGKTGLFSRGGTPATPLFVKDVGGGLGGAAAGGVGAGKGSMLLKARSVTVQGAVVSVAVAEAVNAGIKQAGMLKHNLPAIGGGQFGIPGLPTAGGTGAASSAQQLNRELKLQANSWDAVRNKAADYFTFIERGPKQYHTQIKLDNLEQTRRAIDAFVLQQRTIHITSQFDTPGTQPPNHTPSRTAGAASRAGGGVQINIGQVVAPDYKGLMTDMQRRASRAGTDNLR